ncbi:MAG: hypothetical protein IJ882_03270 [Paludibacteraceae bacterium]|nr:hypothetical protein [Paludibacteraceae bacterium]
MGEKRSIMTNMVTAYSTPPAAVNPRVGWDVNRFETLIQTQGYDALIDRALRCPCCDRASGQAMSTCRNCGGRGWFFVDRTSTRLIAQHMDSKKRYDEWSEVNRGTASITTRGIDKLGFMDRIILTQLEEWFSETLRPVLWDNEFVAYPIYEPLEISNVFLFASDTAPLIPLSEDMYTVQGNKIVFAAEIVNLVDIEALDIQDVNQIPLQITMRYSHYPVYHVIDMNRELMRVREGKLCGQGYDEYLRQMPINVLARKAHYIFDNQKWGETIYDNTVIPPAERH